MRDLDKSRRKPKNKNASSVTPNNPSNKPQILEDDLTERELHAARSMPGTFTPQKREQFLELYATGCTVAAACQQIGISKVTVFNTIRKDPEFAARYGEVMECNTDALEDLLHAMARSGNVAALFGTLKARRPEKYKDRLDLSNKDGTLIGQLAAAVRAVHGVGGAVDSSGRVPATH